jgi:hypothetical protein
MIRLAIAKQEATIYPAIQRVFSSYLLDFKTEGTYKLELPR